MVKRKINICYDHACINAYDDHADIIVASISIAIILIGISYIIRASN